MSDLADIVDLPSARCFACGAERRGIVSPCRACGRRPKKVEDWREAFGLSGYSNVSAVPRMSPNDARRSNPVYQAISKRSVDDVFSDRQLRDLLQIEGVERAVASPATGGDGATSSTRSEQRENTSFSDLKLSPFYRLGVSSNDPKSKIRLFADKLLASGADDVERQVAIIINPETRLAAELRWLGDVSDTQAESIIAGRQGAAHALEPLARVNLDCHSIARSTGLAVDRLVDAIVRADTVSDESGVESLLRSINKSRSAACLDSVADTGVMKLALRQRMAEVTGVYVAALDTLPSDELLDCFDQICAPTRVPGTVVRALVNHYRRFAEPLLTSEGDKFVAICCRGANVLNTNRKLPAGFVERLGALLALYFRVLRPMRSSAQGLGAARTLSRLMSEALGELCEAAQGRVPAETASQLADLHARYFRRR